MKHTTKEMYQREGGAVAAEQRGRSALDGLNESIPSLRNQAGLTSEAVLSNRKRLDKRASASRELRDIARRDREQGL